MSGGGTMTPVAPGPGTLTGRQIADRAWRITKDTDESNRRADSELILCYVNDALTALNADLPNLLLNAAGDSMGTFVTIADLGDVTVFNRDRLKTLSSHVVASIYREDIDDDKNLEMSKIHFAIYQQGVNANV